MNAARLKRGGLVARPQRPKEDTMPKIINEMPAATRGSRAPKYPWDEWFDGQAREFVQGDGDDADFKATIRSFTGMAYAAGRTYGKKVVIRKTGENTIAMQASDLAPGEEPAPRRRRKAAEAE